MRYLRYLRELWLWFWHAIEYRKSTREAWAYARRQASKDKQRG